MTELFTDPKNLVKDLSTVIVDAIWKYSPGRFKKDIFPKDKRYELIKSLILTSDVMIFQTLNTQELGKLRAQFDKYKFFRKVTPEQYLQTILSNLRTSLRIGASGKMY